VQIRVNVNVQALHIKSSNFWLESAVDEMHVQLFSFASVVFLVHACVDVRPIATASKSNVCNSGLLLTEQDT